MHADWRFWLIKVDGEFFPEPPPNISNLCTMAQHVLAREKSKNNKMLLKNVGNYTNNVQVMWKITRDYCSAVQKTNKKKDNKKSPAGFKPVKVHHYSNYHFVLLICLEICMDNVQEMLSVLDECFMTDSRPHCDCVVPRANQCISPKQMSSKQKLEGDTGSSFKPRL